MLSDVRNTPRKEGLIRRFTAAATIYTGALVALDASGNALPAGSTGALTVVGVAQASAISSETVDVRRGVFAFENATGGTAVTAAHVGLACYVYDDATVQVVDAEDIDSSVVAGLVYAIDDYGVWVDVGADTLTVNADERPDRSLTTAGAIAAGDLVAINSSGLAIAAGASGTVRVVGQAIAAAESGASVAIRRGIRHFKNIATGTTVTAAHIGSVCYVSDEETVQVVATEDIATSIVAGVVYDIDDTGVWVDLSAGAITINVTTGA